MQILDGKVVSKVVRDSLKKEISELSSAGKKTPHLAAILVGTNGASETYVASKVKNCEEVGMKSTLIRFDENISEQVLINAVKKLNEDNDVDGILVQFPLPKHISEEKNRNIFNRTSQ